MLFVGVGETDVGRKRRSNEDSLLIDDEHGIYVVADGMGGHAAGEVAATEAVKTVARVLREQHPVLQRAGQADGDSQKLMRAVEFAVQEASRRVYRLATSQPAYAGMGCALTALVLVGQKAAMGHVGDTRLYLARGGRLHQMSTDHTMAQELRSAGVDVDAQGAGRLDHVLTRSVGTQELVRVDRLALDVLPGDRFLLCSDGVTKYVPDSTALARVVAADRFETIPEQLIQTANEGGGADNITAIVVRAEAEEAERPVLVTLRTDVRVRIETLGALFLFEGLPLSHLARVLNVCDVATVAAGAAVVTEGEPLERLLVVLEGRLAIERAGERLKEIGPGESVGATTLLDTRPSRASLRALAPTKILTLDGGRLRALARERPWLGVTLLERLGEHLSQELSGVHASGDCRPPAV